MAVAQSTSIITCRATIPRVSTASKLYNRMTFQLKLTLNVNIF
jgi:hypothetical protein